MFLIVVYQQSEGRGNRAELPGNVLGVLKKNVFIRRLITLIHGDFTINHISFSPFYPGSVRRRYMRIHGVITSASNFLHFVYTEVIYRNTWFEIAFLV